MDITRTAATIIARAQEKYGSADALDFKVASEGLAPYGELYEETYLLANEDYPPVAPGDGEDQLAGRKARAAQMWEQALPELSAYAARCRESRYTGWSRESGGSIRRVS